MSFLGHQIVETFVLTMLNIRYTSKSKETMCTVWPLECHYFKMSFSLNSVIETCVFMLEKKYYLHTLSPAVANSAAKPRWANANLWYDNQQSQINFYRKKKHFWGYCLILKFTISNWLKEGWQLEATSGRNLVIKQQLELQVVFDWVSE